MDSGAAEAIEAGGCSAAAQQQQGICCMPPWCRSRVHELPQVLMLRMRRPHHEELRLWASQLLLSKSSLLEALQQQVLPKQTLTGV